MIRDLGQEWSSRAHVTVEGAHVTRGRALIGRREARVGRLLANQPVRLGVNVIRIEVVRTT